MKNLFILILLLLLAIFYYFNLISKEKFILYDTNVIYSNQNLNVVPQPNQSDIDYQAYLNNISGYDSATRGYYNPYYAQEIARELDTN
jgi:hypothetical protein